MGQIIIIIQIRFQNIYNKFIFRPQISQITRIMLPITAAKAAIMLDFTDCFAQLIASLVAVIEI